MPTLFSKISILTVATLLLAACNTKETTATSVAESRPAEVPIPSQSHHATVPQKGTPVAANLVCMVNDAYMGREQIPVIVNGDTYYGCCEMCKERLPKDESVRYAIDPYSLKKINKATAYIVVIGDMGEVAYFENEIHFQKFKSQQP